MTARKEQVACWVDLEATGSDERSGHIFEVAAIITTLDGEALEMGRFQRVVLPAEWDGAQDLLNGVPATALLGPEVGMMHDRNGLIAELRRYAPEPRKVIDDELTAWRLSVCDEFGVNRRMVLAGSGVAHFDGRWLLHHYPRFAGGLTYYTLDVGVLRRACSWAGGKTVELPQEPKTHRAMDDITAHLKEWREYAAILGAES